MVATAFLSMWISNTKLLSVMMLPWMSIVSQLKRYQQPIENENQFMVKPLS